MNHINQLPEEVLGHIFSFCDEKTQKVVIPQVCHYWDDIQQITKLLFPEEKEIVFLHKHEFEQIKQISNYYKTFVNYHSKENKRTLNVNGMTHRELLNFFEYQKGNINKDNIFDAIQTAFYLLDEQLIEQCQSFVNDFLNDCFHQLNEYRKNEAVLKQQINQSEIYFKEDCSEKNEYLNQLNQELRENESKIDNYIKIINKFILDFEEISVPVKINLSFCNVTDENVKFLSKLPLESLDLKGCKKITDKGVEYLKENLSLKDLNLSCSNITNKSLEIVKEMPLHTLNLSYCKQLKTEGLMQLGEISSLKSLNLNFCQVSDELLQYLKSLSLKNLEMAGTLITDEGLMQLKEMISLESLSLARCKEITDDGLKQLKQMKLRSLILDWCSITDKGLTELKEMVSLEHLSLARCKEITNEGLKQLKQMKLRSLNIDSCSQVTDKGLKHLKNLQLISLNIGACKKITDLGLAYLLKMPLQSLNLNWCKITDQGLEKISKLPLKYLDLGACKNISDEGLKYINKISLLFLGLSGCENITEEAVEEMMSRQNIGKLDC